MSTIGERIRDERTRLGVSQKVFAGWGDVSLKSQVLYEKGDRFPDARYLVEIGKHDVDIHYVLTNQRFDDVASGKRQKVYEKPEDAFLVVLDVQEELGLKLDADQLKNLIGYAYTGQVNQKDLKIFIEAAYRLHGIDLPAEDAK